MGSLFAWSAITGQSLQAYDYKLRSWVFLPSPGFPWIYNYRLESWMWYARDTATPSRWFWMPDAHEPNGGSWQTEASLRNEGGG